MRSLALHSALLLTLAHFAAAQDRIEPRRLLGAPRDAGVYHVATGTWSRSQSTAQLGPDVIYNATLSTGYFGVGSWEGDEVIDEGILPGTTNPTFGGPQDAYEIDGFQFSYCSMSSFVDFEFTFYDSFQSCTANACSNLVSTVALPSLPASSACWTVTVDLSGGNAFCLEADGGPCNPGYQGPATNLDHFGWGFRFTTPDGAYTGPVIAGADPTWSPEGEGTCYLPTLTCPAGATANGALDQVTVDTGAGPPSCYYFGGYSNPNGCGGGMHGLFAQFEMLLLTDCTQTCSSAPYTTYCDTGPNQLGSLSINTNVLPQLPVLTTTNLTGGQFAYHLIGNGMGVLTDPPGALGDMCLVGSSPGIGRYVADVGPVIGGTYSTDLINGSTGAGSGQLPNPPGGALLFGDRWHFQTWTRIAGSSRFSDAIVVQF